MNLKRVLVYNFIVFSCTILAQNKNIVVSGFVTDSLQNPLTYVTLIAKAKQEKIKYAISDAKGYYKLQLKKGVTYNLSISHLGYKSINKKILFLENKNNFNIKLNAKNETLNEIIIDYNYQPIEKKKDTITYNLKAFTNGNEFKMKDVLSKLPGIKVDENVIKVQGKTVTKLLVEGKTFFNGSTKLAVENIPAEVMAKIEIISDYKESELLRNLADNEDLALNVVLKENKKDFAFGDIEAGASVGLDEFYSLHTALFKYNPKSNISFIGDINNFNNSSLSFSDLSRLIVGSSNLFKRNNLSSSLLNFASNKKERFKSVTRFSALNFRKEFNDTFNISGYTIYSNNDIVNKSASIRQYFGDVPITEIRNDFRNTDNGSAIVNLKLDYNPNSNQKWNYNINYLNNNSDYTKTSVSSSKNTNQFFTNVDGKSDSFSHNLEGYLKVNDKHTMGLAIHHSIGNSKFTENWSSNSPILEEYLPLTQSTNYRINQKNKITSQRFNIILKDYWLASKFYHLFYNIGFNYKESKIKSDLIQVLTDNSIINFPEISNNNSLILSDLNFGFGIKSQLGKVELTLEAKPHYYNFKRSKIKNTNLFIEPKFTANYKIDDDINLDFDYIFTNKYLNDLSYLENLKVTGFNTVIQGNPTLTDERSHNLGIYYSNYKNIDNYFLDASVDYSINNPVKNNSIIQSGINQLNAPVILNLPEESLSFNSNFGLMFSKSSLEFSMSLDWLKTNQIINKEISIINSFEYNLSSKWLLKLNKKTQLNLKYEHSTYQVRYDKDSRSRENILSLNFDTKFLKNLIFKTDFSTHFIDDFSSNTQNYTLQNLYLGYSKPNSKFSYSLNFKNIYNNGIIIRNSFNNNLLISNQIYTLPRVFLLELKYKF